MSQCKVCNQEMKWVPAGISKATGRPYNTFEVCPAGCRQPQAPKPAYQQAPNPVYNAPTVTPSRDFQAEAFGKCKYGFLLELLKKDVQLEQAEPMAESWAKASMRTIAQNTFGQGKTWEQAKQDLSNAGLPTIEVPANQEYYQPDVSNLDLTKIPF